jgi:hypothetical protein
VRFILFIIAQGYRIPIHHVMIELVPNIFCESLFYRLNTSDLPAISYMVIFIGHVLTDSSAGGFSEKQQRITELSDPALRIAGKPFLTAYAQGVNNSDWGMHHIWKGAPYENQTVDDVSSFHSVPTSPQIAKQ